jgi:dihydrofolate synthase / folylpolyglutamate synthase
VKAVREGIEHAFLAGRFQVLPGNPRVILDVSHNEESLAASLETLLGISAPDRNVLLFAVQAHKRLGNFPSKALRSARLILLATLDSERGATSEDLLQLFQRCRHSNAASVESLPGIGTAVRRAKKSLRKGDSLLILGSHMTVENAVRYL